MIKVFAAPVQASFLVNVCDGQQPATAPQSSPGEMVSGFLE